MSLAVFGLLISVLAVEIFVPWEMGFIRNPSDNVGAFEILKNVLTSAGHEIGLKIVAYGLAVLIVVFRPTDLGPLAAAIVMVIGGINLFYFKKGQPKA